VFVRLPEPLALAAAAGRSVRRKSAVDIAPTSLRVAFAGDGAPVVDGALYAAVKADESVWTIGERSFPRALFLAVAASAPAHASLLMRNTTTPKTPAPKQTNTTKNRRRRRCHHAAQALPPRLLRRRRDQRGHLVAQPHGRRAAGRGHSARARARRLLFGPVRRHR
jgi:hypothetical protein